MKRPPLPRTAAIHDLSGFGRASLSVVIPVLSSMGIQVCALPTAVLSSQTTGMTGFTFCDLTDQLDAVLDHWKKLDVSFDAVYSGFLGSPKQAETVLRCIRELKSEDGIILVDPVLGDDGRLDPTQTREMVESMRVLVRHADVITPNLTEAAFLLGREYDPALTDEELKDQLRALSASGPDVVVITSAPGEGPAAEPRSRRSMRVAAYEKESGRFWQTSHPSVPAYYPGTGDTFAAVFLGALLRGESVPMAMTRAAEFVYNAILTTYGYGTPAMEGIMLEKVLPAVNGRITAGYTAF